MAHVLVSLAAALSLAASASAAHFAVLVAGSSGYSNYREGRAPAARPRRAAFARLPAHTNLPNAPPPLPALAPTNAGHHADICHAQRILVRNGEAPRARALAAPAC